MSGLIPGYEYDVFVSYRQKDNKHDGWVTDFVEHLKAELESTFKEEVSLYFDVNPHDGLLETHDVEASLKEKLKCLVFIPVISQTYCDPNSFAWEHEFKAFIDLASGDKHGLKVKLQNGNISNRVLPVRIHDLEEEDIHLCESLVGGQLRGIDFIYREPGVNRPLTPKDKEKNNLNNTLYRNQINKVANAIKEVIFGLKGIAVLTLNENNLPGESKPGTNNGDKRKEQIIHITSLPRNRKRLILILSFFLFLVIAFGIFQSTKSILQTRQFANLEKSIAVLPFKNQNPEEKLEITCDDLTLSVIYYLRMVREFNVPPIQVLETFKEENKSVQDIGRELSVSYVLKGYYVKIENLVLIVELTRAIDRKVVWTNRYDYTKLQDAYALLIDITNEIAISLKTYLTAEEKTRIQHRPTKDPVVFTNYIKGNSSSEDFIYNFQKGDKYYNSITDSNSFKKALGFYDEAIKLAPDFGLAYARRAIVRSWAIHANHIKNGNVNDNIQKCWEDVVMAQKYNKELPETQAALGFYNYYCLKDYQKALDCFSKASDRDHLNWKYVYYQALILRRNGRWQESREKMDLVLQSDPQDPLYLTNIGLSYIYAREYERALKCQDKAIEIMPQWSPPYNNKIETLLLRDGNTKEARTVLAEAMRKTGNNFLDTRILLDYYEKKFGEALNLVEIADSSCDLTQGEKFLLSAGIHGYLNHPDLSEFNYKNALTFYEKKLRIDAENPVDYSFLGIALAGLNQKEKAVEAGKKAVKLTENDILGRRAREKDLAQIYVMTGDFEKGMKQIEELIKNPSRISLNFLMLDPVWKPILNRQDFQSFCKKYNEEKKL